MMGAVSKAAVMLVFAMLFTTASGGRFSRFSSPQSAEHTRLPVASFTTLSPTLEDYVVPVGCTPKSIARDIVIYCRAPLHMQMPIDECCGFAVGAVARPACYCLVKKEPSFGMSGLHNVTKMEILLSRCGAAVDLLDILHNKCDGTYAKQPPAECPSSPAPPVSCKQKWCLIITVIAFVGWFLFVVIGLAFISRGPAPAVEGLEMMQLIFGDGDLHQRLLEEDDQQLHQGAGIRAQRASGIQLARLSLGEDNSHYEGNHSEPDTSTSVLEIQLTQLSLGEDNSHHRLLQEGNHSQADTSTSVLEIQSAQLPLGEDNSHHRLLQEGNHSEAHRSTSVLEIQLAQLSLGEDNSHHRLLQEGNHSETDTSTSVLQIQLAQLSLGEDNSHHRLLQEGNHSEAHASSSGMENQLPLLALTEDQRLLEEGNLQLNEGAESNEMLSLLGKRRRVKNRRYFGSDWNNQTTRDGAKRARK